jgi:chromosome segregation ATPase
VALTLVGCGPSKEVETLQKRAREVAANIDDRRAELQSAKTTFGEQSQQCETAKGNDADRSVALRETMTGILDGVVQSGANNQAAAGHSWEIAVESLSPDSWTWREEETVVAVDNRGNVGAVVDKLTYSVDPRSLAAKVEVGEYSGLPAVRIRCEGDAKCIRVKGERRAGAGNGYSGRSDTSRSDVSEMNDHNWWAVSTAADSGRLAQAASDLIALQRGSSSGICEAANKTKTGVTALETEIANLENQLAELRRDLRRLDADLE